MYDPSMGWGGACRRVHVPKVARYIGCEPSTKTFAGLKQMEADLGAGADGSLISPPLRI